MKDKDFSKRENVVELEYSSSDDNMDYTMANGGRVFILTILEFSYMLHALFFSNVAYLFLRILTIRFCSNSFDLLKRNAMLLYLQH